MEAIKKMHIFAWDDAAVREAIQQQRGPLFIANPHATKLDALAAGVYHAGPDDLARLAHAVARTIKKDLPLGEELGEPAQELAGNVAEALLEAKNPLIVCGISCASAAVIKAAANVAWALREQGHSPKLSFVVGQCNTMGLAMMGANPISKALGAVNDGQARTVIVLESDLYRFMPKADADAMLSAPNVIVLDHLATGTVGQALKCAEENAMPPPAAAGAGMRGALDMPARISKDEIRGGMAPRQDGRATVIFSAATFAESTGTLVNNEGRAQRFFQVFAPAQTIRPSWRWLGEIGRAAGKRSMEWPHEDHVLAAVAQALPAFAGVQAVAPGADFRVVGQKMPRQPHRYSGRTAITADVDVGEPKPPSDPDSPMAFSMEGYTGQPPEPLLAHYWAPGWNSVQALNKFQQEVGGPMKQSLPGLVLIKSPDTDHPRYFGDVPQAYHPRKGSLLVLPAWHIFGADEQSVLSPGVKELSPQPYLAIGAGDAKCLGLSEGDEITILLAGCEESLPVRIREELRDGLALMPMGLAGRPYVELPAWAQIVRPEAIVSGEQPGMEASP
jgi:NADH-quinone oxidoreductase subunit G